MVVVDSSAILDFLLTTERAEWVAQRLAAGDLHAPHVLDVEVLGVLRRIVRRGELTERRARRTIDSLTELALTRYPHVPLLGAMWAMRDNVASRDAAFVALARALGADLLTTDGRLARAPVAGVTILAP